MTIHIRSKERVAKHGEVFTPEHIVKDMHALLTPEQWADPSMIYLEPTCGNGQFIVDAIRKKLDAGLSPIAACNTVFGLDIMKDNIEECRQRVWDLVKPLVHASKRNRLRAIIVYNMVHVKDSLEFIKSGKWEAMKFFDEDPTEVGGQVLSLERQKSILKAIHRGGLLP